MISTVPTIPYVRSRESPARLPRMETRAVVEWPVTRPRVREMQKLLKEQWGWSARKMAVHLHISRAYLKLIESGRRPITERFTRAFRQLERDYRYWLREQESQPSLEVGQVVIVCKPNLTIPPRYHVLRPIVKCKTHGCGIWFEQVNSRHRKCTRECKPQTRPKKNPRAAGQIQRGVSQPPKIPKTCT